MAVFLSNYVFPTRYSLGATQIQGAQTRSPTLILPCITPCSHGKSCTHIFNFRYGMNNSLMVRTLDIHLSFHHHFSESLLFFILSAAIKNIHLRCHFRLLKAFKNGKIRSCVACVACLHAVIICVFDVILFVKVSYFKAWNMLKSKLFWGLAPNHIGRPSEQATLAQ